MLSIYHNLLFRIRSNQYLISRQNKHQMFKFIERMVCICDFSTFHRKHGSICNLIWTSCMKNNIWFRIRCRHISRVEFSLAIAMAKSSRLCDIEYSVVLSKKRILTIRPPFDITLENGIFAGKSVCFRIYKSFWKWHSPSQRVRFVPFHSRNNQSDWIKIAAIYNINEWKWFKVTFFFTSYMNMNVLTSPNCVVHNKCVTVSKWISVKKEYQLFRPCAQTRWCWRIKSVENQPGMNSPDARWLTLQKRNAEHVECKIQIGLRNDSHNFIIIYSATEPGRKKPGDIVCVQIWVCVYLIQFFFRTFVNHVAEFRWCHSSTFQIETTFCSIKC